MLPVSRWLVLVAFLFSSVYGLEPLFAFFVIFLSLFQLSVLVVGVGSEVCGRLPNNVQLQHDGVEVAAVRVDVFHVHPGLSEHMHHANDESKTITNGGSAFGQGADEAGEPMDATERRMVDGPTVHPVENLNDADRPVAKSVPVLPLTAYAIIPNVFDAFEVVYVWYELIIVFLVWVEVCQGCHVLTRRRLCGIDRLILHAL